MDKRQLQEILSSEYQPVFWREVLTDVFGVRNLLKTPAPIRLPANEIADSAVELGSFDTSDDRIIGLYQINLKTEVAIGRKKVALRELLRKVYRNDVDGALVVFVDQYKWRLSFISEIRVIAKDGSVETKVTEPKRYTYLLGKGEKVKTPTDRLSLLVNKDISLEDIRTAFSVEALNKEFYDRVSKLFYGLVGATTVKGKKTTKYERTMKLPGASS
ncbi:MAG: DNA modification methylase, partial [Pyrinomonadaceae bacterium]